MNVRLRPGRDRRPACPVSVRSWDAAVPNPGARRAAEDGTVAHSYAIHIGTPCFTAAP